MADLRTTTGVVQEQGPGEDPLLHYTRVFVKFFQYVFGSFSPGNYHWESDQSLSEVAITDQATINSDAVEQRPAIIVARGPISSGNIAIDQFAGPHFSQAPDGSKKLVSNWDAQSGRRMHTDLMAASMSVNCLSSEGLEAQRLAWLCFMSIRRLKRSLMKAGLHRVGEELSIGSESAPGSLVQPDTNEIVMVSVSVPFYFQDFWSVEPVDKVLLQTVDVALRSEPNHTMPGATQLQEPGLNGMTLRNTKQVSLDQRVQVTRTLKPRK